MSQLEHLQFMLNLVRDILENVAKCPHCEGCAAMATNYLDTLYEEIQVLGITR